MDARVLKLYGTLETAPSAKVQWLQIFMAPKIGGCHLVSRVHELYGSKSSGCKITSIGVEFVPKLNAHQTEMKREQMNVLEVKLF